MMMPKEQTSGIEASRANYDRIYEQGSSRLSNEGLIGIRYRLPKTFSLLHERYRHSGPLEILEIGAGVGEVAQMLLNSKIDVRRYVGLEYSLPAVKHMHAKGIDCAQMSGEYLAFPNNSFDLVFCFDVMHHVSDPKRMAREIVRVTRRHFFLSEANGVSPIRKLGELNALARSLGEQSYFPWVYRSFFPRDQIKYIEIRPFYVLVPPSTPEPLIPLVINVSEIGQHVAGLRWIGQSLEIAGEKRQS
jgi:SAM-dependent methyltransferase